MDIRNYLTCLWPGLSELWWRGRLSALPLAIGFASVLNSLLVLKNFYPDWLSPFLVHSAWWVLVIVWLGWTVKSVRELPGLINPREVSETPDRFAEAQQAYLQSRWEDAELLLLQTLAVEPRDAPALLLLSGVYRHTERWENARALMEETLRLELAETWQIEIDAEIARVARYSELADSDGDVEESQKGNDSDAAADLAAA